MSTSRPAQRSKRTNVSPTDEGVALQQEADSFAAETRRVSVLEQDMIEAGVDLVHRIVNHLSQTCGSLTARDRALALIGRHTG